MSETLAIFIALTGAPGVLREVGAYESEVVDESSSICHVENNKLLGMSVTPLTQ